MKTLGLALALLLCLIAGCHKTYQANNSIWHAYYTAEFNVRYHMLAGDKDGVLIDWTKERNELKALYESGEPDSKHEVDLDRLYLTKLKIEHRESETTPEQMETLHDVQHSLNVDWGCEETYTERR